MIFKHSKWISALLLTFLITPSLASERPLKRILGPMFETVTSFSLEDPSAGSTGDKPIELSFLKELKLEDIESASVTFFQVHSTRQSEKWENDPSFPHLRFYLKLKCEECKKTDQIGIEINPSSWKVPRGNSYRLQLIRQLLAKMKDAGVRFEIKDSWTGENNFWFSSDAEIPKDKILQIIEPVFGEKSIIGSRGFDFDNPSVSLHFEIMLVQDPEGTKQLQEKVIQDEVESLLAVRFGSEEKPNGKAGRAFRALAPAEFDEIFKTLKAKNAPEAEIGKALFEKAVEISQKILK